MEHQPHRRHAQGLRTWSKGHGSYPLQQLALSLSGSAAPERTGTQSIESIISLALVVRCTLRQLASRGEQIRTFTSRSKRLSSMRCTQQQLQNHQHNSDNPPRAAEDQPAVPGHHYHPHFPIITRVTSYRGVRHEENQRPSWFFPSRAMFCPPTELSVELGSAMRPSCSTLPPSRPIRHRCSAVVLGAPRIGMSFLAVDAGRGGGRRAHGGLNGCQAPREWHSLWGDA